MRKRLRILHWRVKRAVRSGLPLERLPKVTYPPRAAKLQTMLDRARDRSERSLHYTAVVDCVLAPVYLRYLLGMDIDEPDLELFVARTLTSPELPNTG